MTEKELYIAFTAFKKVEESFKGLIYLYGNAFIWLT